MLRTILALCLVALGGASQAEQPLPPVPSGLHKVSVIDCTDNATGEKGRCVMEEDLAGNKYIVFKQDDQIMFIRQLLPDATYFDLWVADRFASY